MAQARSHRAGGRHVSERLRTLPRVTSIGFVRGVGIVPEVGTSLAAVLSPVGTERVARGRWAALTLRFCRQTTYTGWTLTTSPAIFASAASQAGSKSSPSGRDGAASQHRRFEPSRHPASETETGPTIRRRGVLPVSRPGRATGRVPRPGDWPVSCHKRTSRHKTSSRFVRGTLG